MGIGNKKGNASKLATVAKVEDDKNAFAAAKARARSQRNVGAF